MCFKELFFNGYDCIVDVHQNGKFLYARMADVCSYPFYKFLSADELLQVSH